jgi:hypothetical protein
MITEETKILYGKWEKTKLLNGLDEANKHKAIQLFENQRIYHEALPDHAMTSRMKRLAIPVLRRTIDALARVGVDYEVEREYISFPHQITTSIKCLSYEADGRYSSLGGDLHLMLDAEAELCLIMTQQLTERIRAHVAYRKWENPKIKTFVFLGIGQDVQSDSLVIFCRER